MKLKERRYSIDHHWAERIPAGVRVGLTDFAQEELGEITYLQLPEIGTRVDRGDSVCAIDALKAASELYAPVGGTVIAVNERLREPSECRLINQDAEESGWIFELTVASDNEFDELLDADGYRALISPS